MSLLEKNMSWAPQWSHTRLRQCLILEGYPGWTGGLKGSQWGTEEHPHVCTSSQPYSASLGTILVYLVFQGDKNVHKDFGEGQTAFTAASAGRGGPVCLFCLFIKYKFGLRVKKQVMKGLIKPYLCISFHTPKNANKEKREHALHVCDSHQNPTYSMWLFHPFGKCQKL